LGLKLGHTPKPNGFSSFSWLKKCPLSMVITHFQTRTYGQGTRPVGWTSDQSFSDCDPWVCWCHREYQPLPASHSWVFLGKTTLPPIPKSNPQVTSHTHQNGLSISDREHEPK
jgi:hypothetical protein